MQGPAQEGSRESRRDLGLPVGQEPEDPPLHHGRQGGLGHEDRDGGHGHHCGELRDGEVAEAEGIEDGLDGGGDGRDAGARHGHGGEDADQRDADQVEQAQGDLDRGCGEEQAPLAGGQEANRLAERVDDRVALEVDDVLAAAIRDALARRGGRILTHPANLLGFPYPQAS